MDDADILKNVVLHSVAIALASMVFPVPGGPNNNTPFHGAKRPVKSSGYFVGMTQHCGLQGNVSDFRKCVRSIRINPFTSFLYWRMNWHTEHHMYAGVPCYNLKKLSQIIADDMPQPRTLLDAWREMLEIQKKQMKDPTYQFDTPLPASANQKSIKNSDELADSIGELAPAGLE